MELTDEDIAHILRLLEQSHFEEIEIEWKGLRIRATKRPEGFRTRTGAPTFVQASATREITAAPGSARSVTSQHVLTQPEKAATIDATERHDPALAEIKAPVLGTFYRRPEPGAEPFVKIGDHVSSEQTVCLLEVMKVYTAIKAGVSGSIEQICVEDGQLVDYEQVLFRIRPEPSAQKGGAI